MVLLVIIAPHYLHTVAFVFSIPYLPHSRSQLIGVVDYLYLYLLFYLFYLTYTYSTPYTYHLPPTLYSSTLYALLPPFPTSFPTFYSPLCFLSFLNPSLLVSLRFPRRCYRFAFPTVPVLCSSRPQSISPVLNWSPALHELVQFCCYQCPASP